MTPGTLIVNYHYCVTAQENPWLARTAVAPMRFAEQLAQLERSGSDILVTFDDGTRDVFMNALPHLARSKNIRAILFCCSQPLIERRVLNVTKIHLLQGKLGFPVFKQRFLAALDSVSGEYDLDDPKRIGLGHIYRYDDEDTRNFKLLLNVRLPPTILTAVLDALFEVEFGDQALWAEALYMSVDQLKECQDRGVTIGMHTHSHTMLSRLDDRAQQYEIETPAVFFRGQLGTVIDTLSYPFGVPGTWNDVTKQALQRFNVRRAYTLGRRRYGLNPNEDPLEIPRFDVNDVFSVDGKPKLPL